MRQMTLRVFAGIIFVLLLSSLSYGETVNIDALVAEFSKATDVQRSQIVNAQKLKAISVSATVQNVEDWNTFDERTDTSGHYYKVVTEQQTTSSGTPYTTLVVYKDKAKVEPLGRGQKIEASGVFMKIIDEMGSFSIWVFGDELTAEDKVMLEL